MRLYGVNEMKALKYEVYSSFDTKKHRVFYNRGKADEQLQAWIDDDKSNGHGDTDDTYIMVIYIDYELTETR